MILIRLNIDDDVSVEWLQLQVQTSVLKIDQSVRVEAMRSVVQEFRSHRIRLNWTMVEHRVTGF